MAEASLKKDADDGRDPRFKGIDRVLKRLQFKQDTLIEVLTSAQEAFGYLAEVEGAHTLDMGGRGIQSRVIAGMNQPWGTSRSCTGCGKCVQVCPTGALFKKGSSAAEMVKQHDFLTWIPDGREKKIYH